MRRPFRALVPLGLIGLGVLPACSNMSGPKSAQVREWASSASFAADDAVIETDLADMARGVKDHELLAVRTVCEAFGADVEAVYGVLPTPDTTLTNELANATQTYYSAAISCYAAKSFTSPAFSAYEAGVKKGDVAYAAAKRRLAAVESGQ